MQINQLNYQHLFYFWVVANEQSVTLASKKLSLSPSTISTQIRTLEEHLGVTLFERTNRAMTLTEMGERIHSYAEDIFSLGQEMLDMVHGHLNNRLLKLRIGLSDAIPKLVALKLIEPALHLDNPVQLICREDHSEPLLAELAAHRIDVILQDAPVSASAPIRAFNHLLGESCIKLFASPSLLDAHPISTPADLDGAPFLLPPPHTTLRISVDEWFDTHKIRPRLVGEFEDSALMKTFGQQGIGFFPAPGIISEEIQSQYHVDELFELEGVIERFYAVSLEQRLEHPGVQVLANTARDQIFDS